MIETQDEALVAATLDIVGQDASDNALALYLKVAAMLLIGLRNRIALMVGHACGRECSQLRSELERGNS